MNQSEVINHSEIEERHITELYVMGRLTAADTARFEEHFLTCDECLDRLQLAERFHSALGAVAAEDTAQSATQMGVLLVWTRLARWQRGLLALGLVFAVAWPTSQWLRLSHQQQALVAELEGAQGPQFLSTLLPLGVVRSSPTEPPAAQLSLGADTEWVALSLALSTAFPPDANPLEKSPAEPLRVLLYGPQGDLAWQGIARPEGASDQLLISLPTAILEVGEHTVQVESMATEPRVVGEYRFRVAGAPDGGGSK